MPVNVVIPTGIESSFPKNLDNIVTPPRCPSITGKPDLSTTLNTATTNPNTTNPTTNNTNTNTTNNTTNNTTTPSNSASQMHSAKRLHREVRFGSYILGSTLGEGEFGKVKLGWRKDGKHPSQVAIKLIKRSSIVKDSDSEIKIHREINSLKLLNHPNIVSLVEVMKSGKYVGIVLEYASGGELFDYILQHKYLKEPVAKKIFAQLVSGVDYMHAKGLIHRDLKLENLLLDKHNNVIISDFGFVNSCNKEHGELMKTSCGSPCYAAPELVLTQSPYHGRKVDIWSLGVILYAMLSGYLPFDDDPENEDGSDIIKLYQYICKTPLTFPEYVTPLARDLLRKIIVSDPTKRINIDEIRNHPFLTPYSALLSVRQPEWDRIYKEKQMPAKVVQQQQQQQVSSYNKRYSMVNVPTNSSSLVTSTMHHNTSQISQLQQHLQMQLQNQTQAISPTAATARSSHSRSYSSTSISLLYASPSMSNSATSNLEDSIDSLALSKTPSPKKASSVSPTRGHQKSASISNSQSSASFALKAVVNDDLMNRPSAYNNYTSQSMIPTIVESPTKPTTTTTQTSILVPSKEFSKLPPTVKKPRPTSYHPSSMSSSSFLTASTHSSNYKEMLKFSKAPNYMSQYISTSPPKPFEPLNEYTRVGAGAGAGAGGNGSGGSSSIGNGTQISVSRRNSEVTHVHVNGVLGNENAPRSGSPESKRNSVLSYWEDKIEALEAGESYYSLSKAGFEGVEASVSPTLDIQKSNEVKEEVVKEEKIEETSKDIMEESEITAADKSKSEDFEQEIVPFMPMEEYITKSKTGDEDDVEILVTTKIDTPPLEKSEPVIVVNQAKVDAGSKRHSMPARRDRVFSDENKENRETKKKNRFSLLSFYSTYNSSASNVSIPAPKEIIQQQQQQQQQQQMNGTSVTTATTSVKHSRKVLEPTNDTNIMKKYDQKKLNSATTTTTPASSSSSKRHSIAISSSTSGPSSSKANKESSAARKVMDFFRRRSVRVG
ncbi:hypothetical protein KGF56_003369 [Candida oxycetoniae]|uniref:non-specific serine/threonine protein kinase n=1 Tax=Candida oxycetoniae TaxID=497107 RepID=A0AAI9SW32_9ASCO|nr:uncharacterized protein KGF56_003369 [Candida oxycetoniae]KAI3403809.1 hypothetical protein KGF56_003369 [Candida oxycetoniae]